MIIMWAWYFTEALIEGLMEQAIDAYWQAEYDATVKRLNL